MIWFLLPISAALFATFMAVMQVSGAEYPQQSMQSRTYASSTAITLTWGQSVNVVGTSTFTAATTLLPATAGRTGLTVQTVNCQPNSEVWLQFNDVNAATTTGMWLAASTTRTFSQDVPMVYGAIKALASTNNCTLMVTEWRSQY